MDKIKIIITDISTRKAFDLTNILLFKGLSLILCDASSSTLLNLSYKKDFEILRKDENFENDLITILNKYKDFKLIYYPLEEDTTLLIYDFIKKYNFSNFFYNLPAKNSFDIARDKSLFSIFCQKNLLPIPTEYKKEQLLKSDSLPSKLIIKPKNGSGSMGIKYIDTKKEFLSLKDFDFSNYIIQQRLQNSKDIKGAFFLFDKGKLINYYGHKRIRTYPKSGGVTIFSKCEIDENLKELGVKLLQKLNWSGFAMVEFLYDNKTKSYKIIEVNPRLWGSLMLGEFCGSKILENYYLTTLQKPIQKDSINTNKYIRWVFPWDVISYLENRGKIEGFWNFKKENICYINFSYTTFSKAIFFTLSNILSLKKIKKLYKKVLS